MGKGASCEYLDLVEAHLERQPLWYLEAQAYADTPQAQAEQAQIAAEDS